MTLGRHKCHVLSMEVFCQNRETQQNSMFSHSEYMDPPAWICISVRWNQFKRDESWEHLDWMCP